MSEHNLILEFYKPTYNLDFDYDGDGGLDLHFTNIKGEFFMTMNDSYNSVYIEDEDCEFSKGEMFATVDLGDLVERIINGEFRQTNGKAINDWSKRFIGDDEEQIEFNGKNYADGSLFWDDFFKEMPKDEIKDFMTFCEDYLDLPNIEVDTVSDKYDFENGKVELKSNGKWSITVNDDYTIILVDKFTCNSIDACNAYDVASSESDEDDYYELKKSVRKSLKENELFSSNTPYEIKVNGKKIKSHSDYEVVYDRVENDEYILGIKIKGVGNAQLRFSSKNEAKELGWIINESKKSARKSLKEGINDELIAISSDGETTLYLSDERQANHGKDPHYEFKLGENRYFTRYIRCDDNHCENVVLDWIKEFDLDISKSEISKIIKLHESKKSVRNSLKEYLVKGLDVDFVVDHLLSLEDLDNIDLINKLGDLWEVYKKSWSKFNKSLSDFWKVMKNIEKLDSFDDTCKEIIDAWYDDIEKIFYSDDNLENLKLTYGFEGNDIF